MVSVSIYVYFLFKNNLGQKYYAPRIQPDRDLNFELMISSIFHVTEMPALTTKPLVTSHLFQI